MKTLALTLAMIISVINMSATSNTPNNNGKKKDVAKERMQTSVNHQVNRHIYYPESDSKKELEGKADVMLGVSPEGDVHIIMIQTANPLMKKFIEKQVQKMKVNKNEVVAGEIFKYRFVFRAKE